MYQYTDSRVTDFVRQLHIVTRDVEAAHTELQFDYCVQYRKEYQESLKALVSSLRAVLSDVYSPD